MTNYRRTKPRHGRLKGKEMEALRRDCYHRDYERCCECRCWVRWESGYWDSMHMAHIGAKRRYGDSLDNVRTLCPACHRNEHNAGGKPCPKKVQIANT